MFQLIQGLLVLYYLHEARHVLRRQILGALIDAVSFHTDDGLLDGLCQIVFRLDLMYRRVEQPRGFILLFLILEQIDNHRRIYASRLLKL